jgi:diguanylate cyclase (GGDEF)-like protein/PAS domain S-box-containing protein
MVFVQQLIDGSMDSSGQADSLENLSRALASNRFTALMLANQQGQIMVMSQAMQELIHCSPDDAPLTVFDLLTNHAPLQQMLNNPRTGDNLPKDYQWEDTLQTLNGLTIPISARASWLGLNLYLVQIIEKGGAMNHRQEIDSLKRQVAHLENTVETYRLETDTLKRSERLYRKAFNQTFQLSSLLTPEGIILETNQTVLEFCQLSREESIGQPFFELHCWQISAEVKQRIQDSIVKARKGETIRFETDIGNPVHNIITIDFSLKPLLSEAGNVEFLLAEGRDVTARKQAELSLQVSESRFRSILENIPLVGVILDQQANIIFANDFFLELTGWPREAILHQNWFDRFIPAAKRDEVYRQTFDAALQDEMVGTHYEYPILTHWGEERLISWRATTLTDAGGNLTEVACIGEDITDRRRGEHRLQQQAVQEQLLADITHQVRQSLDLDTILKTAVNQIQQALQAEQVLVFRLAPQGEGQTVASSPSRQRVLQPPKRDFSVGRRRRYLMPGSEPQLVDAPIVRQAGHGDRQVWGLLLVYVYYPVNDFIEVEWFLRQLADQLAVAIHQSELYQQAQAEVLNRQQAADRFRHDARHDALTGLPNYPYLLEHLNALMEPDPSAQAEHEQQFAVLFLDLNDFKTINDTFGHNLGDQLLRVVAQRLRTCIRETDVVARRSGDEFLFLLHPIDGPREAIDVARRVEQALQQPISFHPQRLTISGSIGIVIGPQDCADADTILQAADTAMYEAKGRGIPYYLWPHHHGI